MSSSIVIPFQYLWDQKSNKFKDIIDIEYEYEYHEGVGIQLIPSVGIEVNVPTVQPGVYSVLNLELTPYIPSQGESGKHPTFTTFYFSGFIDSCKAIIKALDMPEDTEIH